MKHRVLFQRLTAPLFVTLIMALPPLTVIAVETSGPPNLGCPECCPQVDSPHPGGAIDKPGATPRKTGLEVWKQTTLHGIYAGCEEDEYKIRQYIYEIQWEIDQVIHMNSRCEPRDTPECQASQNWWADQPPRQWMQNVPPTYYPYRESSCMGPGDILT